jgi:hypothetical protein
LPSKNAIFLKSVLIHLVSISPSTKRKKWSKEAMCPAIRIVRSGDMGYLRASKYFLCREELWRGM